MNKKELFDVYKNNCHSNRDRIKLLIENIKVKPNRRNCKNEQKFHELQKFGDEAFQNQPFPVALKLYTKALQFAPSKNPSKENLLDFTETLNCLNSGYDKRSALFYDRQLYNAAVRDIDRALENQDLKINQEHLIIRKIKCFIFMQKYCDAENLINEYKVKSVTIGNEGFESELVELEKIVKKNLIMRKEKDHFENGKMLIMNDSASCEEYPTSTQYPGIKMESSPSCGRYMIAEQNISPGNLIQGDKNAN